MAHGLFQARQISRGLRDGAHRRGMGTKVDAVRHQIVERRTPCRLLQPVDATEPAIVQQYDGQLHPHGDRSRDLRVHHQVAAVANHDDNLA